VVDLFPFTAILEDDSAVWPERDTQIENGSWMRQMPTVQPLEIERILDTQVAKHTHRKEYLQYLVKWKNRPIEDSSWIDAAHIQRVGYYVEELMEWSHDFCYPGSLMQEHPAQGKQEDRCLSYRLQVGSLIGHSTWVHFIFSNNFYHLGPNSRLHFVISFSFFFQVNI